MLIDAIDHVQLAMPPGGEELATWCYEGVLGVPRIPKPPHLAIRGGCWFEHGALRIHLGVQDDFVPATKAHPAFAVTDLDRLEQDLMLAGLSGERVDEDEGPQLYVLDPFGNRLEFRPERPVSERSAYADTIVSVAAESVGDRAAGQLDFVQELDRLKSVQRQSFILDGLRRENTAEHSWHVAMLALVFADLAPDDVDIDRVVRMLLVHDIVEIDAGDTGIHDDINRESKAARELAAADRLFGLLPDDVGASLRALWDEYEAGDSADAGFARTFDRLSPFLLNAAGAGLPWKRWNVTADRVRNVMEAVGEGAPDLAPFVEAMIARVIADGRLPERQGLILPPA